MVFGGSGLTPSQLGADMQLQISLEKASVQWNLEMVNRRSLIELDTDAALTEDGTPCIVIDFKVPPRLDFDKFF